MNNMIYSPVPQANIQGGGIQYPPPNFVQCNGNMINIASQGYNNPMMYSNNPMGYNNIPMGGYYSNNYTIYNPYLIEEQRKLEEAKRKELMRQNSDMMKSISKKVNHSLGNEISEETLKELYDPIELRTTERDIAIQNTYRLMQIDQYNMQMNISYQNPMYIAMGRVQEQNQQKLDPEMGLYDFLSVAGELISDSIKDEAMRKRKDITNLYNRSDYQKLIDLRSKGMEFSGTFNPNANIDDMEITLPERLKNEYQRRKELFMEKIINRGGR